MTLIDGNLALKRKRQVPRARRIPVSALPDRSGQLQRQALQVRREMTLRRIRLISALVLLVLFVSGIYGLVLYRQAQILEANFAAVALEQQIQQYKKQSSQIKEALAQKTDFDLIRQQASSRLGLQDPARSQIIKVYVPDLDRIVYSGLGSNIDEDSRLAGVYATIEGYFKTIRLSKSGD